MAYEMKEQPATLKNFVASLGLEYRAEFVPFSRSRNAKTVQRPTDLSINWRVTVKKGNQSITTDYMQGIGHLPKYRNQSTMGRCTVDELKALTAACETGKRVNDPYSFMPVGIVKLQAPEAHDVLWSLSMDADAIDHATFEDWASDFGYETDSRQAESIYKQCLEIGHKLRAMLGDSTLSELRDAAQDY